MMETIFFFFGSVAFFLWINGVLSKAKRDDTDLADKRSGMILYTDHKTGVQYVGTLFGGLTPRIDADGNPVCLTETKTCGTNPHLSC